MADPLSLALSVFLYVGYVGENNGFPDTPGAAYVCGFNKAKYELPRAGDVGVFFVPATDSRFEIQGVRIDNDHAGDYSQRAAVVGARQLSFYGANTTKQEIYFTVDILDKVTGKTVACDPTIQNEMPV